MLAKSLLEGYSFGSVQGSKYSAKDGANRIAMESAMELRDIYESTFYKIDELELTAYAASMESADQSVQEGIGETIKKTASSAWTKLKEWLIKLKNKVMEWFNNLRRYVDGIFMSGKEFVTKYENQLKKLNLKDYEFQDAPDFKHDLIDKPNIKEVYEKQKMDKDIKELEQDTFNFRTKENKTADSIIKDKDIEAKKAAYEKTLKPILPAGMDYDDINKEDVKKAKYAELLGGSFNVNSEPSTTDYKVDINFVIAKLKDTSTYTNTLAKAQRDIKSNYDTAIKTIDKIADEMEAAGNTQRATRTRLMSEYYSKLQNVINGYVDAYTAAQTTRTAFFKKVVTSAFAYSRKKDKADKADK